MKLYIYNFTKKGGLLYIFFMKKWVYSIFFQAKGGLYCIFIVSIGAYGGAHGWYGGGLFYIIQAELGVFPRYFLYH